MFNGCLTGVSCVWVETIGDKTFEPEITKAGRGRVKIGFLGFDSPGKQKMR